MIYKEIKLILISFDLYIGRGISVALLSPVLFYPWYDIFYIVSMIKRLLQMLYHVSPKENCERMKMSKFIILSATFWTYLTSIFIVISLNNINSLLIHTVWFLKVKNIFRVSWVPLISKKRKCHYIRFMYDYPLCPQI